MAQICRIGAESGKPSETWSKLVKIGCNLTGLEQMLPKSCARLGEIGAHFRRIWPNLGQNWSTASVKVGPNSADAGQITGSGPHPRTDQCACMRDALTLFPALFPATSASSHGLRTSIHAPKSVRPRAGVRSLAPSDDGSSGSGSEGLREGLGEPVVRCRRLGVDADRFGVLRGLPPHPLRP